MTRLARQKTISGSIAWLRRATALATGVVGLSVGSSFADQTRFDPSPTPVEAHIYDLPGGFTAHTLAPRTFRFYIGQVQANPSGAGGTGNQTYTLGFDYAVSQRLQLSYEYSQFNDRITYNGTSLGLVNQNDFLGATFKLVDRPDWKLAARGTVGSYGYRSELFRSFNGMNMDNVAYSFHLPLTYAVNDRLEAHVTPGVSVFPDEINGTPFYGTIYQLGAGVTWAASERFRFYGSVNVPFGDGGNTITSTGGLDMVPVYTVGGRYLLSPQAALDIYVTNGFGTTSATRVLTFPSGGDEPVIGTRVVFSPSWGTAQRRTYALEAERSITPGERALRYDGITMSSAHTLERGQLSFRGLTSTEGHQAASVRWALDRDIELGAYYEQLATGSNRPSGRTLGRIDEARTGFWARAQLMDQQVGAPFSLAMKVDAGREFDSRFGVAVVSVPVSYAVSPNLSIAAEAKGAAYGSETLFGLSFGASYQPFDGLQLIGEVTPTSDGEVVWAAGARYNMEQNVGLPASVELQATNAIGNYGAATMINQDDIRYSLGVRFNLDTAPVLDGLFSSLF